MSAALDHLAGRVGTDPLFLANALAEYARSEALSDDGLAAALGCARTDLTRLRLCGAPRGEYFRADIDAIAGHFGIDSGALTEIVRRGQSLARLRAARPSEVKPGFLLAARDEDREPPAPGSEDAP